MKETKRLKRADIEWQPYLTPTQYGLLDRLLYRSNLDGYALHIRVLARECNINASTASRVCSRFPFITKKGSKRGMIITFDYNKCMEWIVALCNKEQKTVVLCNNDCCFMQPTIDLTNNSITEQVNLPAASNTNTELKDLQGDSNMEETKTLLALDNKSGVLTASQTSTSGNALDNRSPIVALCNKDKFGINSAKSLQLKLSAGIKNIPSPVRHKDLITQLNKRNDSYRFQLCAGRDGFRFNAIDETNKRILITAKAEDYLLHSKVQDMCQHFTKQGFRLLLWVSDTETLYSVANELNN